MRLCLFVAFLSCVIPFDLLAREPLGPSARTTGMVISEIHYHPVTRVDGLDLEFIELHNTEPVNVPLADFRLEGDVQFTFPAGTVIPSNGFVVVALDPAALQSVHGISGVFGPWTGALDNNSGLVELYDSSNTRVLTVEYEDRAPWPVAADGAGHSLFLANPSYGENDVRAWEISQLVDGSPNADDPSVPGSSNALDALVFNELVAHTDLPLLDSIEIYNHGPTPIAIGGCHLSDATTSNFFAIPATTLAPGGHLSFDENQLGFQLSSGGEAVYLWNPAMTRVLDAERFPAQANGVAWGRSPDGSPTFHQLSSITPNAANAPPAFSDIVIHEIMFNPVSADDNLEFVELYNNGGATVDLSDWRFTSGVGYTFPIGTTIAPGGYLVVARDAARLISTYPALTAANCLGDYSGKLANSGEKVTLSRPDDPALPNQDFVVVDEVIYGDGPTWGKYADGGGSSLELIDADADNRYASNWTASDESGKAPWTTVTHTGVLDNGRNNANEVHVMLLGGGVSLIDNISVTSGGGNLVANSTFEAGTGGWIITGNHIDSVHEPAEGDASAASLKLDAQGAGDNGVNRAEHDLSATIASGATATITARMRWQAGHPLALIRLKGNWLEAVGELDVPDALGSPGQANPSAVINAGPPILDMVHDPILPAAFQAVTVTARIDDPQGVASVTLNYRLDPSAALNAVPMNDSGTAPDTVANDGIFAGTIPGQAAGTLVAFTVSASDSSGAVTSYPNTQEALVRFGEPMPNCNGAGFGVYRFWMTDADINQWTSRQKLSNYALPATFVLGDYRVMYDAAARYRGSPFIRPGYNNPLGNLCAYIIRFSKDEPIFGTRKLNMDTLEPGGRDDTHLRERMSFWIGEEIGSTFSHQRYVYLYVNGQLRGEVYADSQQPSDEYLPQWFPGADDGDLYKIDDWFEFNDNGTVGREFNENGRLTPYTTTGGAYKKARYRWSWEKKNGGAPSDDYSGLFGLVDVLSIADDDDYRDAVWAAIDVERFLRTIVHRHVVADWDGYGYQRGKNMSIYQPPGGKWTTLQWDLDFALRQSTTRAILDANSEDPTMDRMFAHPEFRRISWEVIEDACFGPLIAADFAAEMDQWGTALDASCVSAGNRTTVKTWVDDRRTYLLGQLPSSIFDIDTNGGANFTTGLCPVPLTGNSMIGVREIVVNGVPYQPRWIDEITWEIDVAIAPGVNVLTLVGVDEFGVPVAGATDSITVTFNGSKFPPDGWVVINEINYNALATDADFVEIHNRHPSQTFDLTHLRLDGVDFNFAPGTQIGPGDFLLVVEDVTAFNLAYGALPVIGTYNGSLSNGGENLKLVYTNTGAIVDQVQYDDDPPWPITPDGTGPSLQLIDASQDNNRIANWAASSATPLWTPGAQNSVAGLLPFIPNIRLNEVQPINLSTISDNAGDFDSWVELHNLGGNNQTITSTVNYVNQGDIWYYLDDGSNQGTSWSTADPIALGWASGAAELGYGDGGETTTVSFGPNANAKYTTTYFRRDFNVGNPAEIIGLDLQLRRDDGAVVYINGVEVLRDAMPGGAVTHTTFASGVAGGANETTYFPFSIPSSALVAGVNQLAVEIHQVSLTSSDISFDLGMSGTRIQTTGSGPVDLHNFYLTDDLTNLTKWQFPVGASIADLDFEIAWTDAEPAETTATDWHANWTLNPTAGYVALVQSNSPSPLIIDYLPYQAIGADRSYGLYLDGDITGDTYFYNVTPRAMNDPAGLTNQVWINEWMASNNSAFADPADGQFDDWFELYNPGGIAIDISGYTLSDDATNPTQWTIPNGTIIGPGAFLVVWADNETAQNGFNSDLHTNFKLSAGGEDIVLSDPSGALVHTITFGAQVTDITEGSWRDGTPNVYPLGAITPGNTNVLFSPNMVPIVSNPGNQVMDELTTISLPFTATDTNVPPQTLTWSLAPGAPPGAFINPTTGAFTWSPTELDGPGVYTITVVATDDGTFPAAGSVTFTITVSEVNQAPNLLLIPSQTVDEGSNLTFTAATTDLDVPVQTLTYSLAAPSPAGASIQPTTGVFSWTPAEIDGPGVYNVPVVVTDNGMPNLATTQLVQITVNEVNLPPIITPPSSMTWNELVPLSLSVGGSDSDLPAQTLVFGLGPAAPAGSSINPTNGAFAWTPSEVQGPGIYPIDVTLTDSAGLVTTGQFTVTVLEVDTAPVLAPIGNMTVNEGTLLTFVASATDSDIPVETLTFTLDAGAPAGASITPAGVFNWTPVEADGPGTYTVTIRASDDAPVLDDSETIIITVNEADQAPVLSVSTNLTVVELQTLTFTATATDSDTPTEPLSFSLLSGPAGSAINPTNGVFTWTPVEADGPGVFTAVVEVADAAPILATTASVVITVLETNTPPVLGSIGSQSGSQSNALIFTALATDVDLPVQTLTFSLVNPIPGMSITSGGAFSWIPTNSQSPGIYTSIVEVTDGFATDSEAVVFTISDSNIPPKLTGIGPQTVPEGSLLQFTANATDADIPGQTLTFSLDTGAPVGALINPTTGDFTWSPNESDGPGSFFVTVRVTDNGTPAFSDSETVAITVTEVNQAPFATPPGPLSVFEGATLSTMIAGGDLDLPANNLVWTLDPGAPAGVVLQAGGLLTWTPTELQGPSLNVFDLRLTDDGSPVLDTVLTVTVEVFEVNQPPMVNVTSAVTVDEESLLSIPVSASDPDVPAQTVTLSLGSAPAGLTLNPAGNILWSPSEADGPGVFNVELIATDSLGLAATSVVKITVNDVDEAPIIMPPTDVTTPELTLFSIPISGADTDLPAQSVTWSIDPGAPAGLTVDAAGVINWTPSEADGPGVFTVTVRLTDAGGLSDTATFKITVTELGQAPVLVNPGPQSIDELSPLALTVTATDADLPVETLTFALDPGTPAGLSIQASSGALTWTPTEADGPGAYPVTVRVTDSSGLDDTAVFTIMVNDVNAAPTLAPISTLNLTEGDTATFTASGADADLPVQVLAYSLDAGAPAGASINPTTGDFNWTTGESEGPGSFVVTVRVSDGSGMDATRAVTINVAEQNLPPVLVTFPPQTIVEGAAFTITATATDPDLPANTLRFLLGGSAPSGMIINSNTGVIAWTPGEADGPGTFNVTVRVVDDGTPTLADSGTLMITVLETNTPPVLAPIASVSVNEGSPLSFNAVGSDPDLPAQLLTYSLDAGAPGGATISSTGVFLWTPGEADGPGSYMITVRVSDPSGASSVQTFTVSVNDVNAAPSLAPIAAVNVDEGQPVAFTAVGIDTDLPAQVLSYALVPGAPSGSSIDAATGEFDWTPGEADGPGSVTVGVVVSDPSGASSTQNVSITVNEVNQDPVLAAVAGQLVFPGQTSIVTVVATDVDLPAQTLSYALGAAAPAGATLNGNIFSWNPTAADIGTNTIGISVSDGANGIDTITVDILVAPIPVIVDLVHDAAAGQMHVFWPSLGGVDYELECSPEIDAAVWTFVAPLNATGSMSSLPHPVAAADPRMFYRVVVLP